MPAALAVRPAAFVRAADDLYAETSMPTTNAFYVLSTALDASTSMAGTDPGGSAWATSYDAAVVSTVRGWQQLATAVYRVSCLLAQSGLNHAAAESASRPGGTATVQPSRFDPSFTVHFDPLPSGGGGSNDSPTGWGLIEHAVGYVWPGGHQDRLRNAAAAWDVAASTLVDAADGTLIPCVDLADESSPELDDALHTIWALARHLHEIAGACRSLGRACEALAEHIDTMRSHVEHELISLGVQTAAIEVVGAVVSIFTAGTAEAPTQAVESSRIEAVASAVRGAIESFGVAARELAESIPSIAEIGDRIGSAVSRLADARIRIVEVAGAPGLRVLSIGRDERITSTAMTAEDRAEAGLERAAEEELPDVTVSRQQVEKKFKHATALGVDEPRGRVGFERFEQRLQEFVSDPRTERVTGKYRSENAILSYNRMTREVVVQHEDGSFWSAWKVTARQLRLIEERGELGLG